MASPKGQTRRCTGWRRRFWLTHNCPSSFGRRRSDHRGANAALRPRAFLATYLGPEDESAPGTDLYLNALTGQTIVSRNAYVDERRDFVKFVAEEAAWRIKLSSDAVHEADEWDAMRQRVEAYRNLIDGTIAAKIDKWTIGRPQDHAPIEVEFKKLMEDRAPDPSTDDDGGGYTPP